ncbi:hypothetical protein CPC08DRAFT_283334 [Agrocybe pediades]|nr:hypothetical protein CPC08DRAFT_283334 [Agrocybe pediades]
MKSVAFFRNTWRKWENKSADTPDTTTSTTTLVISSPRELKKQHTRASQTNGRSLTISVKQLPENISTASLVDGSWQPVDSSPSSPIYDHFVHKERTIIHRESSHFDLQAIYHPHDTTNAQVTRKSSRTSFLEPPKPWHPRSIKKSTTSLPPVDISSRPAWPSLRIKKDSVSTSRAPSTYSNQQHTSPLSPHPPSLPPTQLLPPIDLNFGPARKQELRHAEPDSHHLADVRSSMPPARVPTASLGDSPKTVHAILDLTHDATPRRLYHSTGSTPYLPYRERVQSTSTAGSDYSTNSVASSDADHFPLSLFPLPPPLIVRKKVPAPLNLRAAPSVSTQSSRDSTPLGTPTTPRIQYTTSPSQSSISSPTKKLPLSRPLASFSPPPFGPPNSPLPQPPVESARRPPRDIVRPLRSSQSHNNFRSASALPFPATHRLTSSEPISDHLSLSIRRPVRPRPTTERPKNIQTYIDQMDIALDRPPTASNTENEVQWGYAL